MIIIQLINLIEEFVTMHEILCQKEKRKYIAAFSE